MVLNAKLGDDEVYTYEGVSLVQITLVGLITEVKASESRKEFTLDDGAGVIQARIWTSGVSGAFQEMVEMCRYPISICSSLNFLPPSFNMSSN